MGAAMSGSGTDAGATAAAGTTAWKTIDTYVQGVTTNPTHLIRYRIWRDGANAADT